MIARGLKTCKYRQDLTIGMTVTSSIKWFMLTYTISDILIQLRYEKRYEN